MPLTVQLDTIPSTGLRLTGTLEDDIFELGEKSIKPTGGITYDLTAVADGGEVLVTGSLSSPFLLECTRCLTEFPYTVELGAYHAEIPTKNAQIVDLTDQVREDILLALPGYPKCEQATGDGRTCPQAGTFDGTGRENTGEQSGSGASGRSEVWDILDDLPKSDDQPS